MPGRWRWRTRRRARSSFGQSDARFYSTSMLFMESSGATRGSMLPPFSLPGKAFHHRVQPGGGARQDAGAGGGRHRKQVCIAHALACHRCGKVLSMRQRCNRAFQSMRPSANRCPQRKHSCLFSAASSVLAAMAAWLMRSNTSSTKARCSSLSHLMPRFASMWW